MSSDYQQFVEQFKARAEQHIQAFEEQARKAQKVTEEASKAADTQTPRTAGKVPKGRVRGVLKPSTSW